MGHRITRAMMALTAAFGLALSLASPAAAARGTGGTNDYGVFRGSAGSVAYKIHIPASYRPGTAMPLLVALHGCWMTGFLLNSMEETTGLSELADKHGFIVVYPSQNPVRNLRMCWNFGQPEHQRRGIGEPSLIAGVTEVALRKYAVDQRRVYVAGASSGAAMAVIMAVTYPDRFAAVGVAAGCEYACDPSVVNDQVSPVETAWRAYGEMGPRARQVPAFIMQGTRDPVVPLREADRLVTHWATIDDLAVDGLLDGDVDDVPESERRVTEPGSYPYTTSVYTARGSVEALIERVIIDGLEHKWPGSNRGLFADPTGPRASELLWRFLSVHSMR